VLLPKELAVRALLLCRPSRRIAFADAILWATARLRDDSVASFDRRFPSVGVQIDVPR
jgi:predicted nucleic acid-binding protein